MEPTQNNDVQYIIEALTQQRDAANNNLVRAHAAMRAQQEEIKRLKAVIENLAKKPEVEPEPEPAV